MMNQDQQFLVKNLQNMIKYIQQETDKKVQMIKKEAGKEADLEKALLINPEKEKIIRRIEKELDEYKTSMKIAQSQKMNKLRLEKLKVKIDCVSSVFEEAKISIQEKIKSKPDEYKNFLKNLVIQGLIKLLDDKVNIICKRNEYNIVSSIIDEAKVEFLAKLKAESKKFAKFDVEIVVDTKYFLPEPIIGGVFLTSLKSKLRVDNTLDKRLELLKQSATPEIRKLLFPLDGKKEPMVVNDKK